jgi:hypothetical protein
MGRQNTTLKCASKRAGRNPLQLWATLHEFAMLNKEAVSERHSVMHTPHTRLVSHTKIMINIKGYQKGATLCGK